MAGIRSEKLYAGHLHGSQRSIRLLEHKHVPDTDPLVALQARAKDQAAFSDEECILYGKEAPTHDDLSSKLWSCRGTPSQAAWYIASKGALT